MDYDFVVYDWLPDYNDPNTFMNMWVTNGGNNHTGFSSVKYDSLINIAETNPDNEKRMEAMQKAEKNANGSNDNCSFILQRLQTG